jgi:antitoxin HicB
MKIEYPCMIVPEEPAGFFVQFVDIEEAITGGDTLEEALFNASEVLAGIFSYRLDNRIDMPLPSDLQPGQYAVAPDTARK